MLVPHLLKMYFGLGWPSLVLEIVSSQRLKTNVYPRLYLYLDLLPIIGFKLFIALWKTLQKGH